MKMRAILTLLVASTVLAYSMPGRAGSWKFEKDERAHPILTYSNEGKVEFRLGCGRALSLEMKYPGKAAASGKASVMISNGRDRMRLNGEFKEPDANDATTFSQLDLGYSRQNPELFGRRWKKTYRRLLDLIGSEKVIVFSSNNSSYRLPPPDFSDWKQPLATCG